MPADRVKELKCYPELHERMLSDQWSVEELADWVRDEKGEYNDVKRDSVVRALYRYKNSLPPQQAMPKHLKKRLENFKGELNEVEELTKLYHVQLGRVSMALGVEDKVQMLTKDTRREIELAKDMLKDLIEAKMQLGLLSRTPHEVIHRKGEMAALEGATSDQKKRLGGAARVVLGSLMDELEKEQKQLAAAEPGDEDDAEEADFEIVS